MPTVASVEFPGAIARLQRETGKIKGFAVAASLGEAGARMRKRRRVLRRRHRLRSQGRILRHGRA
jgi:hypothetical protein